MLHSLTILECWKGGKILIFRSLLLFYGVNFLWGNGSVVSVGGMQYVASALAFRATVPGNVLCMQDTSMLVNPLINVIVL